MPNTPSPSTVTEQNLQQKTPQPKGDPTSLPTTPTFGSASSGSLEEQQEERLRELLPKEKKLAEDLRETYFLIGNLVGNISPFASTVILIEANELAETHVRMARHIKGYYKFLEKLVSFNDYTPFISAHLKVVMVIMAYHDFVRGPAKEHYLQIGQSILNKLPPDILEALANANNGTQPVPGLAAR